MQPARRPARVGGVRPCGPGGGGRHSGRRGRGPVHHPACDRPGRRGGGPYAKTAGYLKQVYVDKGDRVKAGQVLAVIESPELGQQQQQARSAYQQARAATRGVIASKGRAQADTAQAAASVERARSDAMQA